MVDEQSQVGCWGGAARTDGLASIANCSGGAPPCAASSGSSAGACQRAAGASRRAPSSVRRRRVSVEREGAARRRSEQPQEGFAEGGARAETQAARQATRDGQRRRTHTCRLGCCTQLAGVPKLLHLSARRAKHRRAENPRAVGAPARACVGTLGARPRGERARAAAARPRQGGGGVRSVAKQIRSAQPSSAAPTELN